MIVSTTKDSIVTFETSASQKFIKLTIRREEFLPIAQVWDALKKMLVELDPGDDPGLDRRRHEAWAAMAAGQEYADEKQEYPDGKQKPRKVPNREFL